MLFHFLSCDTRFVYAFFCPVRPSLYVCLLLVDFANLCLSLSVAKGLSGCVYVTKRECEIWQALVQLPNKLRMRLLLKVVHAHPLVHPIQGFMTCGVQSIAVWLVIVLSSVSPMSLLLNLHNVASSGVPLHRGKWQHLPMFCLSVCLSVRLSVYLPVACAPTVRLYPYNVCRAYMSFLFKIMLNNHPITPYKFSLLLCNF